MAGPTGQLSDLVAQARRHGVRDEAVLEAIGRVPRQRFVPRRFAAAAFDDAPLPIGEGQTISQPAMVAMMAEAAQLSPDDRVLEVGTGSGYGALVLRALAGRVVTVERRSALAEKARAALAGQGLGAVEVVVGDGTLGWPAAAPYDAIVVTAAGPAPPPPLLEQLTPGGRLVMPVGSLHGEQFLMRYTRPLAADIENSDNADTRHNRTAATADTGHVAVDGNPVLAEECRAERLTAVRFVPLIGAHGFKSDR